MILISIHLPYRIVFFHIDALHTVKGYNIELSDGLIVFRRIAGSHNHPSLRNLMIAEGFALQKLQHSRCQCLGYTVDLIDKQNTFFESGCFHFLINRRYNLTHCVLRDRILSAAEILFLDKRQTDGTLSRMMGNGIRNQCHATLPCHL